MEIKLNRITISNFKGIKDFGVELSGENATISAENGVGKTTIFDAFLWLLFSKNAEGKKDFAVRPLDKDNQPLKGLVVAVEATLACDGTPHTFRKEQQEQIVKKQLRGYTTLCWIDEVPKKVGEYQDYIAKLIAEDTFKLLTDLNHFSGKLHWEDRRKVLLDIAGDTGTPEGFDELVAAMNDRSIKDYESVLKQQKKRYEQERDEINPRIDQVQKGIDGYACEIDSDSITKRDKLQSELRLLQVKQKALLESEKARQVQIDKVNTLKAELSKRASELAGDTSGIKGLLEEKVEIEAGIGQMNTDLQGKKTEIMGKESQLEGHKDSLEIRMGILNNTRAEHKKVSVATVDNNCYACGQKVPASKIAENDEIRKITLAELSKQGEEIFQVIFVNKKEIATAEVRLKIVLETLGTIEAKLQTAEDAKEKRFTEIANLIASNQTISPDKDAAWCRIDMQIKEIERGLGASVAEQLQAIEDERQAKAEAIEQLNKALSQADRIAQDKKSITVLENKENELAQKTADVEKQLAEIGEYKATQSRMIEEAVNGKFKYVEFKMFKQQLNEGLIDCCEATLAGVPYSDMSAGQQIFCGIDIVNVLSDHYGVSVCLFVDHIESLTLPLETSAQLIGLKAVKGVKELTIEKQTTKS